MPTEEEKEKVRKTRAELGLPPLEEGSYSERQTTDYWERHPEDVTPHTPKQSQAQGARKSKSITYFVPNNNRVDLPDANTVWNEARGFAEQLPRKRKNVSTLAEMYLQENPKPLTPDEAIAAEKRRANIALLGEALHLLIDTGSIIGGGNVYQRRPIAANTVADSKARQDYLNSNYQNDLARWRQMYNKILSQSDEEYPDRTVDIFKALYNAYLNAGKEGAKITQKEEQFDKKQEGNEKLAHIRGKYSVAAAKARGKAEGKKVAVPDGKGGWILINQEDVSEFNKNLENIAYNNGNPLSPTLDKRTGKLIAPTKEQEQANKAKILNNNEQARAKREAANKAYKEVRSGGKKKFAPNSQINNDKKNTRQNYGSWQ